MSFVSQEFNTRNNKGRLPGVEALTVAPVAGAGAASASIARVDKERCRCTLRGASPGAGGAMREDRLSGTGRHFQVPTYSPVESAGVVYTRLSPDSQVTLPLSSILTNLNSISVPAGTLTS